MRVYLDLCCLKRPFDSQSQPLVRLETEAVLAILGLADHRVVLLRSAVHVLENSFNTVKARRDAVSAWLSQTELEPLSVRDLAPRSEELMALGLGRFDAFHVAAAEFSSAAVFATVDYPLLGRL